MGRKRQKKESLGPWLERWYLWFDRLGFIKILLVWIGIIIVFGIIYISLGQETGSLRYMKSGNAVGSLLDSIYFSFITATSTGFGDIVPLGANKFISLIEVVIGLTVFALVTSKIVGIKQERILREIYEISMQEKMHRIRSSLYLYRADVSKLITKVEEETLRKRELAELWTFANYLEQRIIEIKEMLMLKKKQHMTDDIDSIDAKLLTNSIVHSLRKTAELLKAFEDHGMDWRREVTVFAFSEACAIAAKTMILLQEHHEASLFKEDMDEFYKEEAIIRELLKV